MKKEDIAFLNQLIQSLEQAESRLEQAYKERDAEKFNKIKKFILQIQNKITEVVKNDTK